MRQRLRSAGARAWQIAKAIAGAVVAVIGRDELLLVTGLVFVTAALWPTVGRLALLVPGAVLVWIGLPPRIGFIIHPIPKAKRSGESH